MQQGPTMKHIANLALTGLLISLAQPLCAQATPPNSAASSPVVAVVNQHAITEHELHQQLNRPDIKAAAEALHEQPAELQKLRKSVLTTMIDKELLLKAATASPSYRPEDIKKEVDAIIQEQGGQAVVQPILSSYGTSWEAFMQDLNDRITIEKFIEKDLLAKVNITDEELKAAFSANPSEYAEPETVSARHILILAKASAPQEQQQKALERIQAIRKQVMAPGADFGTIAAETSDDTASKVDGGNLGTFQRGMMVPEFEKAAFSLKMGEISEPVKTEYGYHLIKVEQHQPSRAPTFESAKEKVRARLMAKTHDKVVTDKLAQLRGSAAIEYKSEEFKRS
jgi:peptidyl-prolyl cis-trans isomerase SurA